MTACARRSSLLHSARAHRVALRARRARRLAQRRGRRERSIGIAGAARRRPPSAMPPAPRAEVRARADADVAASPAPRARLERSQHRPDVRLRAAVVAVRPPERAVHERGDARALAAAADRRAARQRAASVSARGARVHARQIAAAIARSLGPRSGSFAPRACATIRDHVDRRRETADCERPLARDQRVERGDGPEHARGSPVPCAGTARRTTTANRRAA